MILPSVYVFLICIVGALIFRLIDRLVWNLKLAIFLKVLAVAVAATVLRQTLPPIGA